MLDCDWKKSPVCTHCRSDGLYKSLSAELLLLGLKSVKTTFSTVSNINASNRVVLGPNAECLTREEVQALVERERYVVSSTVLCEGR